MNFAIKAEVSDLQAEILTFNAQKTMYGGKQIGAGDKIVGISEATAAFLGGYF